jgi:hypothetical protein
MLIMQNLTEQPTEKIGRGHSATPERCADIFSGADGQEQVVGQADSEQLIVHELTSLLASSMKFVSESGDTHGSLSGKQA